MAPAVLVCDIGNTNIKFGIFSYLGYGDVIPTLPKSISYVLSTVEAGTADSLGLRLLALLDHAGYAPGEIVACVVCSVVPSVDLILGQVCRRYLGCALFFVPGDLPLPLENRYLRTQEVGVDRLVGAYAATVLYPAPAHVVVDFGTATTFDCVIDGVYLGGLICPGVLSSVRALATQAAKLSQISLDVDATALVIGRSTSQSLNHGFVFGFAALAEGLIQRLRPLLGWPDCTLTVVATGGFAEKIASVASCFDVVLPDLILGGLFFLYTRRQ
ncbi:Type III pantothenate kinase [Desulfovibrionales bacterium]